VSAKSVRYALGWAFVRPRRWLFRKMVFNSYLELRFRRLWQDGPIIWPNPHWWILYKTVFKFFKWLDWEAWRPLCTWEKNGLKHKPILARIIHRIGETTAGEAIGGGECFHCASKDGCQVWLADSDETFELIRSWQVGTQDGTDYRTHGITTCPKCGFKDEYEDGSL